MHSVNTVDSHQDASKFSLLSPSYIQVLMSIFVIYSGISEKGSKP